MARLVASPGPKDEGDSCAASYRKPEGDVSFLDPCAGEGSAVLALMQAVLGAEEATEAELFAVELEKGRFEAFKAHLHNRWSQQKCLLHGDAFHAEWNALGENDGVSCLFLNPPYDTDRVYGRLEEKFLARYTDALAPGGTLFFLVPHYALPASAATLGKHYDRVECRRFPSPEFEAFKQVVLVARKAAAPALAPQPIIVKAVEGWAADAGTIPVLGDAERPLWKLPRAARSYGEALAGWRMAPLDVPSILTAAKPWHATKGATTLPVAGILPEPGGDLLRRVYPVATPPRASHIAASIASGVFNGARIEPSDPKSKLPPVLVKGVFDREFRTVDEKQNEDGETVGLVQVQQPKLRVTVLDLTSYKYTTLTPDVKPTEGTVALADGFTTGDLLAHYGPGLLAAQREHCPVLHDHLNPAHAIPLPVAVKGEAPSDPTGPRQLFHAQAHAVMACVKLLGGLNASPARRRGKAAVLAGEIGVGKSTVALAIARTIRAQRTLITCPPHLLDGWTTQIKACIPWAHVSVLRTPTDVEAFAASSLTPAIALLTRETAKLGHALRGITGRCPKCGAATTAGPEVLARRRATCEHVVTTPRSARARTAVTLARLLVQLYPEDARIVPLVQGRALRRRLAHYAAERRVLEDVELAMAVVRSDVRLRNLTREVAAGVALLDGGESDHAGHIEALRHLVAGIDDDAFTAEIAISLWTAALADPERYGSGNSLRGLAQQLLLLMVPGSKAQVTATEQCKQIGPTAVGDYSGKTSWTEFAEVVAALAKGESGGWSLGAKLDRKGGNFTFKETPVGSTEHLAVATVLLAQAGKWRTGAPCGEFLYQSVPQPRRVPLATYIVRRHPKLFDFYVCDEAHEGNASESAQAHAMHRLIGLGIPALAMTGSLMNGYAESLFGNLWALSPSIRAEFGRDQRNLFVDRYGYRKQLVEKREDGKAQPLYGAVTDRIDGASTREIGQAPGVLPLLILKHILPIAVTLQKADLALDLPPCHDLPVVVPASPAQKKAHEVMLKKLVDQIKGDRFEPERAGRLFGMLAEAPSQLDRCTMDTGNGADGDYTIRYPESAGSGIVHRVAGLPASTIMPKEQWMLDTVKAELAEGRNVMVFAWHANLLPRLARLVSEAVGAAQVAVLDPSKVAAGKREAWINKEILARGRRVLVTNAACVQTGLNVLVHFATEIFMESPAVNPIVARQVVGRVDRIGQTKETRIYWPVYDLPAPQHLYKLLMSKVAVSLATDGLDATEALSAAGAGETSEHTGFSVGKVLFELLQGDIAPARRRRTS